MYNVVKTTIGSGTEKGLKVALDPVEGYKDSYALGTTNAGNNESKPKHYQ